MNRPRLAGFKLTGDTIKDLDRSRDFAIRSEPTVAAEILYQIAFLPPARTNDYLDRIYEYERQKHVVEVIEYLRNETGEDLGGDAVKWIEKYAQYEMPL